MVQGKKQINSKSMFAEVVIGDNEAKEMRESANARNRRNPYLKLSYPNGVTLIRPADIMDNLKDWKGVALMCDGYSGYHWLKKVNGRILCRSCPKTNGTSLEGKS